MRIIGLTGSIGMGKSTTLRLFAEEGCATWDADAAVHRLYAQGGAAVGPVEARFPGVTGADGGIDRERLLERIQADPAGFADLEAIVHPLVRDDRAAWLEAARADGRAFAVVDVPLLFETGDGVEAARDQVRAVLAVLSTPEWRSRRPDALHSGVERGE